MAIAGLRVVQVSDESRVGQGLADALGARATVTFMPVRQVGAGWTTAWKPLAILPRYLEARRIRLQVERLTPRADLMHIHWLPNGLIGTMQPRGASRIPWVLHIHGSDIRAVTGWRLAGYRRLLRAADAVVFSTPDLGPEVWRWRPDAEHLPVPIALNPTVRAPEWDAIAASTALPVKGAAAAFAALRLIAAARPEARLAAMTGPAFESGPWEELPAMPHAQFIDQLAAAKVVIGQLKLGALGVVELEAMAIGRPVVGWTQDGLYPDAAPLVSAAEPRSVADSVLGLLDNPSRRNELGDQGVLWVRRHHDAETVARQLLAIYRRVVGSAHGL